MKNGVLDMTEIGKFLKKLRIDNNEILLAMAQKLEVSPSFLSAVELGKKKMPYEWNLRIRSVYSLTAAQEEELDEAISLSEKSVILDLSEASPAAKKLAVSFARSFNDFTDEQLEALRSLMQNEEDE
jgi:transcriptional regulator with XRE-family HTH domain